MPQTKYDILLEVVTKNSDKVDALNKKLEDFEKERAKQAKKPTEEEKKLVAEKKINEALTKLQVDHERTLADIKRQALPRAKKEAEIEKEITKLKEKQAKLEKSDPKRVDLRKRQLNLEQQLTASQTKQSALLGGMLKKLVAIGAAYITIQKGLQLIQSIGERGFQFNATLETAELGIAAVLKQFDEFGRFENFDEAIVAAGDALDLLKKKAAESPATLQQLILAFQSVSGAATKAGINVKDQVDLITLLSQTLSALGIRSEQILQESRALITGNITEDALAARILGITGADIRQATETGQLYEFLTGKLEAFEEAGERAASTYSVAKSNFADAFDQFAGVVTEGAFEKATALIQQLSGAIDDLRENIESVKENGFNFPSNDEFRRRAIERLGGQGKRRQVSGIASVNSSNAKEVLGGITEEQIAYAIEIEKYLEQNRNQFIREAKISFGAFEEQVKNRAVSGIAARNTPKFKTVLNTDALDGVSDLQLSQRAFDLAKAKLETERQIAEEKVAQKDAQYEANKEAARLEDIDEGIRLLKEKHAENLEEINFRHLDTKEQQLALETKIAVAQNEYYDAMEDTAIDSEKVVKLYAEILALQEQLLELRKQDRDVVKEITEAEIAALARNQGLVNARGRGFVKNNESLLDRAKSNVEGREVFGFNEGTGGFEGTGETEGGLDDPAEHFQSVSDAAQAAVYEYAATVGTLGDQMNDSMLTIFGSMTSAGKKAFTSILGDTEFWTKKLGNIAGPIMGAVTESIAQMAAEWITSRLLMSAVSQTATATETATSAGAAATTAAAWTPAALVTSVASFGAAPAIGLAALLAVIAAGVAGFEEGGFPSGRNALIRVNENGQELVANAGNTSRNAAALVAGNQGATLGVVSPGGGGSSGDGEGMTVIVVADMEDALRKAAGIEGPVTITQVRNEIRKRS